MWARFRTHHVITQPGASAIRHVTAQSSPYDEGEEREHEEESPMNADNDETAGA
jgi:hypothetical protein